MSQRTPANSTLIYSKVVEKYAHFFERPEARLRFLNNTLAEHAAYREKADALFARFGFIRKLKSSDKLYAHLLRLELYRLIFRELGKLLPKANGKQPSLRVVSKRAPLSARVVFGCYQYRHALYVAGALLTLAALFGIYTGAAWSVRHANDYLAKYYLSGQPAGAAAEPGAAYAQSPVAKNLPGYAPEKVWLVEQKDEYERYSNGARILRDYETGNNSRGYLVFERGKATTDGRVRSEPVGIVYHTSESDMLPFTPDNNDSIETRTRGLLEYVRRNKSYNYLIDRFGQIYRIVRDEDAAYHSGNSVWSDSRGTYVGLNESFLGVCFETKMEAGSTEERLTEAQLVAGRLLTQVLRGRHQIDDANCVTHGLVSVNPSNMLICFHSDWAAGFPFEAMGLSDKYLVAPASVGEFGFTYDEEVKGKLGGSVWPGVREAEAEFAARAMQEKLEPDEMRGFGRARYRRQMEMQRGLRAAPAPTQQGAHPADAGRSSGVE